MLECVINLSEGRRPEVVAEIAAAAGRSLLDVHSDPFHNRSVLTMAGDVGGAARNVATVALSLLDISSHAGVHPRLGVVDVVPFVPLDDWLGPAGTREVGAAGAALGTAGAALGTAGAALGTAGLAVALEERDAFVRWFAGKGVPCFSYGPERSLPEVRRSAFSSLGPDAGPAAPHPTAGACCVGARPVLVAYNLVLKMGTSLCDARRIASEIRTPQVRALGFAIGEEVQVSCNLVDPLAFGPADAYDAVAGRAAISRSELVGLLPRLVLDAIDPGRYAALDLDESKTIEARLAKGK